MFKHLFNNIIRGGGRSQTAPSLDSFLEQADHHLSNFETLIPPVPESKPRTSFDTNLPKEAVSMFNLTPKQKLKVMTKGVPLFANMQVGTRMREHDLFTAEIVLQD